MTPEKHLLFNIICNMLQMCGNMLLYFLHGHVLDMISLTRTRKLQLCKRHPTKTSNTTNLFHLLHIYSAHLQVMCYIMIRISRYKTFVVTHSPTTYQQWVRLVGTEVFAISQKHWRQGNIKTDGLNIKLNLNLALSQQQCCILKGIKAHNILLCVCE